MIRRVGGSVHYGPSLVGWAAWRVRAHLRDGRAPLLLLLDLNDIRRICPTSLSHTHTLSLSLPLLFVGYPLLLAHATLLFSFRQLVVHHHFLPVPCLFSCLLFCREMQKQLYLPSSAHAHTQHMHPLYQLKRDKEIRDRCTHLVFV